MIRCAHGCEALLVNWGITSGSDSLKLSWFYSTSLHRASLKANWNSCAFLSTGSRCCSLIDRVKIILWVRTTLRPLLPFASWPVSVFTSSLPCSLDLLPFLYLLLLFCPLGLPPFPSSPLPSPPSPSPGGWWGGGHSGSGRLITCSDMKKLARGFSNESDYSSPAAPVAVGQRGEVGDGTPAGETQRPVRGWEGWGATFTSGVPPMQKMLRHWLDQLWIRALPRVCDIPLVNTAGAPPPTGEHFKPKGFIFPSDHICKQLLKPDVPRRTLKPQTSSRLRNSPYGRRRPKSRPGAGTAERRKP